MADYSEVFIGIDVAKARNAVAIAEGERGGEVRFLGEVDASEESMRRVVKRIAAKHDRAHFCYEAGPTGYGLHRLITSLGHSCTVVAPSLIPRKPGDRVKTNRRDALALAKLLRAGELTAVWVPDEGHEAMRDLVRARAAAVETSARAPAAGERLHAQARPRLPAEEGLDDARTCVGCRSRSFDHPAHQIALQEMVDAVRNFEGAGGAARADDRRVCAELVDWLRSFVALQALRGVDLIVAAVLSSPRSATCGRFESPRQLMGYLGLVPSERSTGDDRSAGWHHKGRQRAGPPHAGRKRLDLSASAADRSAKKLYRLEHVPPRVRDIAWKAQTRLTARYRALQRTGQEDDGRLHGHRSRTRRLHVGGRAGGADRLALTAGAAHLSRTGGGGTTAGEIPSDRFVAGFAPTPAVRSGQPRTHTRNAVTNPRIRA